MTIRLVTKEFQIDCSPEPPQIVRPGTEITSKPVPNFTATESQLWEITYGGKRGLALSTDIDRCTEVLSGHLRPVS
jgi:hypothetical protein